MDKDPEPNKKKEFLKKSSENIGKEDQESAEEMANLVLESMSDSFQTELEPFEVYSRTLRSHILRNEDQFKKQFLMGYGSLLQQISSKK
ncbi:MAG: hypothetical protein H0V82_11520 [Candidatus Protochlamydia sp.]|nr:hypothetical protein [Candidatus Protochlamydia sp.]